MGGVSRLLRSLLLTVGAVAGAACLLLAAAAPVLGLRPLIFLSGSMSPAIPAGSLALARETPAADLRVGDVVTVPVDRGYVTHRIVEVTHRPGAATLRLQGDASPSPDGTAYDVRSAPRTFVSVPHLGSAVSWLSRPPGVFVLAGYVVLVLQVLRRGEPDRPGGRTGRGRGRRVAPRTGSWSPVPSALMRMRAGRTGVVWAGLLTPWLLAPPAHAAWTDTVTVSGPQLGTATVSATTARCGGPWPEPATLAWDAVPHATGYRLHYGADAATVEDLPAGTTSKVLPDSTVFGHTFYVEALFGSWVSAASNAKTYNVTAGAPDYILSWCVAA